LADTGGYSRGEGGEDVTFHEAMRRLVSSAISIRDVASATGVSAQAIRSSGLDPSSASYRAPPRSWREACIGLAQKRVEALHELIEELETDLRTLPTESTEPELLA
jgi:hypothetical protein